MDRIRSLISNIFQKTHGLFFLAKLLPLLKRAGKMKLQNINKDIFIKITTKDAFSLEGMYAIDYNMSF